MMSYFGIVSKGHTLDLPNAALGLLFYSASLLHNTVIANVLGFGHGAARGIMLAASLLSVCASTFLIYTLIMMNDFCIVCAATHVINSVILVAAACRVCGGCTDSRSEPHEKKVQ